MQFRATIIINYQMLTCGNSGLELDRLDRLWRLQVFISACDVQLILLMNEPHICDEVWPRKICEKQVYSSLDSSTTSSREFLTQSVLKKSSVWCILQSLFQSVLCLLSMWFWFLPWFASFSVYSEPRPWPEAWRLVPGKRASSAAAFSLPELVSKVISKLF